MLSTLPAPRPGPTLDRCTQTPMPTLVVHKGWTIHPAVYRPTGKWRGHIMNADNTHASYLRVDFDTPELAHAAMVTMIDDRDEQAVAERERNYLAGVDGGDENPAQYSNDNG